MSSTVFSLDLSSIRSRMKAMLQLSADDNGRPVTFKVVGNGNVLDEPVVSKSTGRVMAKKVFNTNMLNSIAAAYHVALYKEAAKLEALGQSEAASEKLIEYLNKCTVSFSALEGQSAFDLANGSVVVGHAQLREGKNARGEDFRILTIDASTIQAPKPVVLKTTSDSFLDTLLGSSEAIPSTPAPSAPAPKAPAPKAPSAPVVMKLVDSQPYSVADLVAAGWAPADIAALPSA